MASLELKYAVTAEETLAWARYLVKSSESSRKQRRSWILSGYAIAIIMGGILLWKSRVAWVDWVIGIIFLTYGLSTPYWYDWHVDRALRQQASDPRRGGEFGEHRLILGDEGMREIAPVTESFVRWANVSTFEIIGEHLFITLASGEGAIINRRAYSGPVPFDELLTKMREFKTRSA